MCTRIANILHVPTAVSQMLARKDAIESESQKVELPLRPRIACCTRVTPLPPAPLPAPLLEVTLQNICGQCGSHFYCPINLPEHSSSDASFVIPRLTACYFTVLLPLGASGPKKREGESSFTRYTGTERQTHTHAGELFISYK